MTAEEGWARTREALIEAMRRAPEKVTASDARSIFEHRGYRLLDQLLWQTL
jgi:hypothetical protein